MRYEYLYVRVRREVPPEPMWGEREVVEIVIDIDRDDIEPTDTIEVPFEEVETA